MEYLITFIEGVASFISPCILPIIPIYISCFATESKSLKKSFWNSIGFVFGFSIIFVLLGVFAGTFGKLVSEYSDYIYIFLGLLLVVMGLNYIGVIFVKFLNKSSGISKAKDNFTFISSLLFGIFFSLSWTPCVGAFLSSALILASSSHSVLKGAFLLLLYSFGLGIPFIMTTLFMEKVKSTFDFIKKNYLIINRISGSILLFYGLWNIVKGLCGIFG